MDRQMEWQLDFKCISISGKRRGRRCQNGVRGTATNCDSNFGTAQYVHLNKVFQPQVRIYNITIDTVKKHMKNKKIDYVGIYRKSRIDYIHQSLYEYMRESESI